MKCSSTYSMNRYLTCANFKQNASKSIQLAIYNIYNSYSIWSIRTYCSNPFPDGTLAKRFSRYDTGDESFTSYKVMQYPTIIYNYWRVAKIMQIKNLIPLVHGQTSLWIIPQKILKSLGFSNCQTLRSQSNLKSAEELIKKINAFLQNQKNHPWRHRFFYHLPSFISEKGHLDHQPELRSSLLATTIGLFHCEHDESPFSLVFGGGSKISGSIPGNRSILQVDEIKKIANELITIALREKNYNEEIIQTLIQKIDPIYAEAAALHCGQLLVLGTPQHIISNHVYHSKPFGMPTAIPIQTVIKELANGIIPKQGCQARLFLCKETCDLQSGIEVINIMDETEVETYCKEKNFSDHDIKEELKKILHLSDNTEENARQKFIEIKEKLDKVIKSTIL